MPPQGAGEVSRQYVFAGMGRKAQPVTALFRHGLRRATFPGGEGFCPTNQNLTFIEQYRTGWAQWCNDYHRPYIPGLGVRIRAQIKIYRPPNQKAYAYRAGQNKRSVGQQAENQYKLTVSK